MAVFHGILLINKPSGLTSHDVVNRVRRQLGTKDVGHAGTLDPMAQGLMVLLLGEATKMSSYVLEQDKQYEVTLRLGIETDTLDTTGAVLREGSVSSSDAEVLASALALVGDFEWEVPMYSATKVAGRKLYEQARAGETPVQIPVKPMRFWGIEFLGVTDLHDFRFRLNCSKGSFVRTWVQQLGRRLGCGAVMSGLTRTQSSPYGLEQAIELEAVKDLNLLENKSFVPLLETLPSFKVIRVGGHSEGLIRNGQISHDLRRHLISVYNPEKDQGVKILSQRPEELLALIGLEKDRGFVVRRVFRY